VPYEKGFYFLYYLQVCVCVCSDIQVVRHMTSLLWFSKAIVVQQGCALLMLLSMGPHSATPLAAVLRSVSFSVAQCLIQ